MVKTDQFFRKNLGENEEGMQIDQGLNFLVGTIKTTDIIKMKRMIRNSRSSMDWW